MLTIFDKIFETINALRKRRLTFLFNMFLYYLQRSPNRHPLKLWYKPFTIQIEVTSRCNLNCPHCGISNIPGSMRKDMPLELFQKIAPLFRYMNLVRLFCYGEPLVNPDFLKMVEITKKTGAKVAFHTNGILLTDEISKELVKLKTDLIIFSIDGATEETYRKIRPGGDFKRIISNLNRLNVIKELYRSPYPRISICYTIMKDNLEEMPLMVELANQLKIKSVHFQNVLSFNERANQQSIFNLDPEEVEKIYQETKKRAKFYQIKLRIPKIKLDYHGKIICDYPWQDLQVRSDGLVFVCNCFCYPMHIYHHIENGVLINEKRHIELEVLGDVNKEGLAQIWNNKKYQSLRGHFRLKQAGPPCNTCVFPYGIH